MSPVSLHTILVIATTAMLHSNWFDPWYRKSTNMPADVHGNVTCGFYHAPAQLGTNFHKPQTRSGSIITSWMCFVE